MGECLFPVFFLRLRKSSSWHQIVALTTVKCLTQISTIVNFTPFTLCRLFPVHGLQLQLWTAAFFVDSPEESPGYALHAPRLPTTPHRFPHSVKLSFCVTHFESRSLVVSWHHWIPKGKQKLYGTTQRQAGSKAGAEPSLASRRTHNP